MIPVERINKIVRKDLIYEGIKTVHFILINKATFRGQKGPDLRRD